jgi:chromosome condensin MukBEF ATPase and DNA-binding subunit MukB
MSDRVSELREKLRAVELQEQMFIAEHGDYLARLEERRELFNDMRAKIGLELAYEKAKSAGFPISTRPGAINFAPACLVPVDDDPPSR